MELFEQFRQRYGLSSQTTRLLQRYGFEVGLFQTQQKKLQERGLNKTLADNIVTGDIEALPDDDLLRLPSRSDSLFDKFVGIGKQHIRDGKLAVVILAGGMATRFGGVVKATVEIKPSLSFLDLKLNEIKAVSLRHEASVPVFIMTSFGTHDAIEQAVRVHRPALDIKLCPQSVSIRMDENGDIFKNAKAEVSLYAPGHGEMPNVLRRERGLQGFLKAGGQTLWMSNVDNLLAGIDPLILGMHISERCDMSVEVVAKQSEDTGGGPVKYNGKSQVLEHFRIPSDFDASTVPVFNTNTMLFNARALQKEFPLDAFAATKMVDDRVAVQFETLVGQLTASLSCKFIKVERQGEHNRFIPIKTPDDLESMREDIMKIVKSRMACVNQDA